MIDPVSKGAASVIRAGVAQSAVAAQRTSKNAPLSKLLDTAAALARQGPPIDYARIAQIRQAIATGTYTIDAERIAEALLR
jgi:negative regulator of flagellin synthesis FlgM